MCSTLEVEGSGSTTRNSQGIKAQRTRLVVRAGILAYVILQLSVPSVVGQQSSGLYQGFRNPTATYKPLPIWYWNAKIRPDEVKHQIDQYLQQGSQGAVVYPSTGLMTPFLSEEWWQVWAEVLPYARAKGFQFGWVPEFNDPDGDARDVWMDPPDQSRVLEGHPEYRLKGLAFVERDISGPGKVHFEGLPNPVFAIAARKNNPNSLDDESLVDLSAGIHGSCFQADLDTGNWLLTFYYVVNSEGYKGTSRVDPLNRKATDRYVDLTIGEFARRFPEYVGSTLKYIVLDSEGSFGGPIVWTPAFFESFQAKKGYDFRKYLPLLVHDGGPITAKIRNDYYGIVSDLFVHNFWAPISDWGAQHQLIVVAQELGDSLQLEAAAGGNFMDIQRAMTVPFMEEEESGSAQTFRDPRQFKEPDSIAHFEGRRFWCECLLVQGVGTYVSPQKMRNGTNVIAAWGVNLWSQNTSYDDANAVWPPSMGRIQPHWKYFHDYADLVRRISYMNDGGRHVADVLLFRPTATVVSYSDPAFDNERGRLQGRGRAGYSELGNEDQGRPYLMWGGDYSWQVEMDYWGLMQLLVQKQQDYDVVDDLYLGRAKLKQGAAQLGEESYHVLVLPPMRVISRGSLEKIREFYEQGGYVIAYGSLPSGSTEKGRDDAEVIQTVKAMFGIDPSQSEQAMQETENQHGQSGRAVFIPHGLEKVTEVIARLRPQDFQVVGGSGERLFYLHRVKEGRDLYWVANDSGEARELEVSLAAQGKPELWDPTDGNRKKAVYWKQDGRTIVPLKLNAWDGVYVVLGVEDRAPQTIMTGTNLEDLQLEEKTDGVEAKGWLPASEKQGWVEGSWKGKGFRAVKENPRPAKRQVLSAEGWEFQVAGGGVQAQYAQTMVVGEGEGREMGFAEVGYNDRAWDTAWLSREGRTIREWNLIGPFPNVDHQGFNEAYPPEKEINLGARYAGTDGQQVAWRKYRSDTPETNVQKALALTNAKAVVYALTYVWAPQARQVQALLAGENLKLFVNGKEAFKLHSMPWYYELRDGFASKPTIKLQAGWNQLLAKIEHDPGRFGRIVFSLRLSATAEMPVSGLLFSSQPESPERLRAERAEISKLQERWYRLQVPPGTRALLLPSLAKFRAVYLNGKPIATTDARVEFSNLEWSHPNVIALVTASGGELEDSLQFEAGKSEYRLGSWTWTGLTSFSGEATYEKRFQLDPSLVGKHIELDLGRVGVTAEVWVNEKRVGERVWEPYRLEITEDLHPGENHLRIAVTNSDSNRRADEDAMRYREKKELPGGRAAVYMESLSLSGLLGPVALVPYEKIELHIPQ